MENDENKQEANLEQTQEEETVEEESTGEEEAEESTQEEQTDWEAEAKKWRAIAERNKKKASKSSLKTKDNQDSEDSDDWKKDVEFLKVAEKKRQFGYENGLSPEETDKIFSINPNPSAETLKDPFVQAGLEGIRKSKKVEDNTPSSAKKSQPLPKKKMEEMSQDEKNQAWQEHLRAKGINV